MISHLSLPLIFCIFFWRASVCLPLLRLCRPFCIYERCLIPTQRAAVARRRATNLATHLPILLATHLSNYGSCNSVSVGLIPKYFKSESPAAEKAAHAYRPSSGPNAGNYTRAPNCLASFYSLWGERGRGGPFWDLFFNVSSSVIPVPVSIFEL